MVTDFNGWAHCLIEFIGVFCVGAWRTYGEGGRKVPWVVSSLCHVLIIKYNFLRGYVYRPLWAITSELVCWVGRKTSEFDGSNGIQNVLECQSNILTFLGCHIHCICQFFWTLCIFVTWWRCEDFHIFSQIVCRLFDLETVIQRLRQTNNRCILACQLSHFHLQLFVFSVECAQFHLVFFLLLLYKSFILFCEVSPHALQLGLVGILIVRYV